MKSSALYDCPFSVIEKVLKVELAFQQRKTHILLEVIR